MALPAQDNRTTVRLAEAIRSGPAHGGVPLSRPVFSAELDADPQVRAWLDSLPEETRASLRDDITPLFKEIPTAVHVEVVPEEGQHPESALVTACDEVHDALLEAARDHLPTWQFRAFRLWLGGANRARIARQLGVSRATVRCALDGGGSRDQPGALETIAGADEVRKVVMRVAKKNTEERAAKNDERVLSWFRGAEPAMVTPLAFLLLLDSLADAKNEVPVPDVLPYWPRSLVTPCLQALKAFGYAVSNGHTIKIHKRPEVMR